MRIAFVFFAFLALINLGMGADIRVPWDYSTIQEAIDAAAPGDTVKVFPGLYNENLNFNGKAITVKSDYGPLTTFVNGSQLDSVVTFNSGEGLDSVIDGFTLTNGMAATGGGVRCDSGSSPTIKNNIITANLPDGLVAVGGGIACNLGSSPHILNNTIFLNVTVISGGGIACDTGSEPLIEGNSIFANSSQVNGGGITCLAASPTIVNNFIFSNLITVDAGTGAGIFLAGSSSKIINNTIYENICMGENTTGGGIECSAFSYPVVVNTIIRNNTATSGEEIHIGGGILIGPKLTIRYSNVKAGANAIVVEKKGKLDWGKGMIDGDPMFKSLGSVTYDLHLTKESACINMGTLGDAPATDKDGDARPYLGTVDIGADEYTGTHALSVDNLSLSASAGGILSFDLDAGLFQMNRDYFLFASASGTAPGTPLPDGKTLPLNWDAVTSFVVNYGYPNNMVFTDFYGTLDLLGKSTAKLNTNGPFSNTSGYVLSFSYALLGKPWDYVSNPVNVEVVP